MANYYCLMAGVPELHLTDTKPGYSITELREALQTEIGKRDERLLHFLFLRHDCQNLVHLLNDLKDSKDSKDLKDSIEGNYSRDELVQLIEEAQGVDLGISCFPKFMLQFVREYTEKHGTEGYYAEDEILLHYYQYCTEHCPNKLMRRWYQLNFDVTNIMTALIARKQGWRVSDFVKGDGEVQEMISKNDSRDFNLSGLYDFVPQVMKIVDEDDPVRKEQMLDALKWEWLETETFGDTFSIEAVFAYLCRLEIQERWSHLDVEQGRETFERIISDLRSEAQVPEEFILKK